MERRQTSAQGTYTNFFTKTPSPLGVSAQSTHRRSGLTLHPGQQSPRKSSGDQEAHHPGLANAIGRGLAASIAKAPRRTHPSPYRSSGAEVRLGALQPFNPHGWTRGLLPPSDRPQPAACHRVEARTQSLPANGQSIDFIHHRPTPPKPTSSSGPSGLQPQTGDIVPQHAVRSHVTSPRLPPVPQAPMSNASTARPRHRISGDIFGRRAHSSLIRRTFEVLKDGVSNKENSTDKVSNNEGSNKGALNNKEALSSCAHPETGCQLGHKSTPTISALAASAHKTPETHSQSSRPCALPASEMPSSLPQNLTANRQLQQASSRPCRPGPASTTGPASTRPAIPGSIFGPGPGLRTAISPSTAPVVVDLTRDANEILATWKAKKLDWLKEAAEKRLPQTSGAILGAKRKPGTASGVAPKPVPAAAPAIVLDDDGRPEVLTVTPEVPTLSLAPPAAPLSVPAPKKRGRPRKDPVSKPAAKRQPKTSLIENGVHQDSSVTVALPPTETQKKRKRADTTTPRPAVKRPRKATGPAGDDHADPIVANLRKRKQVTTTTTRPPAKRQRKVAPAVNEDAHDAVRTPGLTRTQHGRSEVEISGEVVEYPTPPRTESGHESEGYLFGDAEDTEPNSDGLDDLFDGVLDQDSQMEDSDDAEHETESVDDELVNFIEAALDETSESGDDVNGDVEMEHNGGEAEETLNGTKQPAESFQPPMQLPSPAPSRHLLDSITYNPNDDEDVSEEE